MLATDTTTSRRQYHLPSSQATIVGPILTVGRTRVALSFITPKLGVGTKQEIMICTVRNGPLDD